MEPGVVGSWYCKVDEEKKNKGGVGGKEGIDTTTFQYCVECEAIKKTGSLFVNSLTF